MYAVAWWSATNSSRSASGFTANSTRHVERRLTNVPISKDMALLSGRLHDESPVHIPFVVRTPDIIGSEDRARRLAGMADAASVTLDRYHPMPLQDVARCRTAGQRPARLGVSVDPRAARTGHPEQDALKSGVELAAVFVLADEGCEGGAERGGIFTS